MTQETEKLISSYRMIGQIISAIKDDRAELVINTRQMWGSDLIEHNYKLDEIFDCPDYLHRIKGDLLMYEADLRDRLMDALVKEREDAMGLDDDPDWMPELQIIPKNDYRRGPETEVDDGR